MSGVDLRYPCCNNCHEGCDGAGDGPDTHTAPCDLCPPNTLGARQIRPALLRDLTEADRG